MKSSEPSTGNSSDIQHFDPITENIYSIEKGSLVVKTKIENDDEKIYPINPFFVGETIRHQYLKFNRVSNNQLVFSPSGRSLICKSDRLHQIDMNMGFTKGVAIWSISCISNCLSLVCGVKNTEKKIEHFLEFSVQNITKMIFKLDISDKKFKAWVNKSFSVVNKSTELSADDIEWTPFIRVKGAGVSIFMSDLVEDPESSVSIYNIFKTNPISEEHKLTLSQLPKIASQEEFKIKSLDENTLLLHSKKSLKLIRRSECEREFNLNLGQFDDNGLYFVEFSANDNYHLKKIGLSLEGEERYCGKSIEDWVNWFSFAFEFVDKQSQKEGASSELYSNIYEILLRKVEIVRPYIKGCVRPSPALNYDILEEWGLNKSLFPLPLTTFTIPESIRLNNEPFYQYPKEIKQIIWTQNFLAFSTVESERCIILSRESSLFKVGEVNLKKGLKKQNELSEFQKEFDSLQALSPNEPSIYKILKNCLKYADKIKVPEKSIKVQKPKEETPVKKEDKIQPDKSLVNTLLGMGFSQVHANKALIEANNNLEKALELIFVQQTTETIKSELITDKTWSCQQCTLLNNENDLVCVACDLPKPIVKEIEQKEEIKEIEEKEKEIMEEIDVISENIEGALEKVFLWELGIGYSPLVIAGLFNGKIRIRLFGPNPKFYSLFYNKDEEFVDLTNNTIHDKSYEIDQKPVRYQFYLNSSQAELKNSAYGWISIEDEDLHIEGNVKNISFRHLGQKNETIYFSILIEGEEEGKSFVKEFEAKLSIDKIYSDKKKSLSISEVEFKKVEENNMKEKPSNVDRVEMNSKIIPNDGFIDVSFAREEASAEIVTVVNEKAEVFEEIHKIQSFLPVIALFEEGSALTTTLGTSLKAGQKPLILKHLHQKAMIVEYIVLKSVGKNPVSSRFSGFISFIEDPSKKALRRVKFELEKGQKKYFIHTNQVHQSTYVRIELDEEQKNGEIQLTEEIVLVGLIGKEIEGKNERGPIKVENIVDQINLSVKELISKEESKEIKMNAQFINFDHDFNSLPIPSLKNTLENTLKLGSKFDIKLRIYNKSQNVLFVDKIELAGWQVVRETSTWTAKPKIISEEENYEETLVKLFSSANLELLSQIISEENRDYHKAIVKGNYNLTDFIITHAIKTPLEKANRNQLLAYLQLISPYFIALNEANNLDYQKLLREVLASESLSIYGLEIVYAITRYFPLSEEITLNDLEKRIELVLGEASKNSKERKTWEESQDLLNSKYLKEKLSSFNDNLIYNRYILKNGKLYKKFTIDLLNLYKINNVSLVFEKSNKKTNFQIILRSFNGNQWKTQFSQNYPEFVFEQVAITPFTEEFEKNVKESKRSSKFNYLSLCLPNQFESRIIEIEVSFSAHPNIGSTKDIEKVPQSEIIPEIQGEYIGEEVNDLEIFKNLDVNSLIFMNTVHDANKYNVKNERNVYFYENNQIQSGVGEDKEVSKQIGENISYFICCAEIDELISKGQNNLPQNLIVRLIKALSILEKSLLFEKIVFLLRKLVKNNGENGSLVLSNKLPNEYTFNSIIKDSILSSEDVTKILENSPTEIQYENAILFAKGREEKCKELFNNILQYSLKHKKIDESALFHEKYGWVSRTSDILDLCIAQNNQKYYKAIISTCKEIDKLPNYCVKLLNENGMNEWFRISFEELTLRKKKIKDEDLVVLFQTLIKFILGNVKSEDEYDETEVFENFSLLTKAINKTELKNTQVFKDLIKLFIEIPQKENILNQVLALKELKSAEYIPDLLTICERMLLNYLKQSANNNSNLSEILEILLFIFRNEVNHEQWVMNLSGEIFNSFCEVFSTLIVKELCLGGEEGSKLIDSNRRLILSIAQHLSILITKICGNKKKIEESANLSEKSITNFFKWILLNSNIKENAIKYQSSKFSKIEDAVWSLIVVASLKKETEAISIFKQQFENYESEISKMRSIIHKKIFEKRLLGVSIKYLSIMEEEGNLCSLLDLLFKKILQRFIDKNEREFESIESGKEEEFCEKEYANSFQFPYENNTQPKDWLLYKNGAKNSVFKFEYPKNASGEYKMLLKISEGQEINLSKILIGFEQVETQQECSYTPREIIVEVGSSEDELKFIGRMIEIPDNHYINFSVRVFGLNCSQVQINKLSSSLNKFPDVKYVRLTMRSPESDLISNSFSESEIPKSKPGSSINFISIQGYSTNTTSHPEIEYISSFVSKISKFNYKEELKYILETLDNIKTFKDSLINFSILMKNDTYSEPINRFIMRICSINTMIGNETIEKYLHLGNSETCAKIVAEIILSNPESFKSRVEILHQFIIQNLESSGKVEPSLEPFLNRFCQVIYSISKNINAKVAEIALHFNTETISKILEKEVTTNIFGKYICTILALESPFKGENLEKETILKILSENSHNLLNEEILHALVVSDKGSRVWFMKNNCLEILYNRIIEEIKSKSVDPKKLQKDLSSLGSLCFSPNTKSLINKNKYNLEIFNLLVSPDYSAVLIADQNNDLRETFVNLITRSVLGSENEKLVAEILKESLTNSAIEENKFFVGQVFLPILNSFSKTTLCVHPYDEEEKKILVDTTLKTSNLGAKPKTQTNHNNKFRLPTSLLNISAKEKLFEKLREKVDSQGGNFNLNANHGSETSTMFHNICEILESNNKSILLLFQAMVLEEKSTVFGIFYKETNDSRTLPIRWNKDCVAFFIRANNEIEFLDTSQQTGVFMNIREELEFEDDYEDENFGEKVIEISYNNSPFCELYSSNLFGASYINLDFLTGTFNKLYELQCAEYWTFEPSINKPIKKEAEEDLSLTSQFLNLHNLSFFESQFETKTILRLLRYDPVYEFPSSLSLAELKSAVEIMRCKLKDTKDTNLKIKSLNLEPIPNETKLQTLLNKSEDSPILDLLCEINSIATMLDSKSNQNTPTSFLPKRGIMKHFEEINGVSSMLKVIKKSIESWKNKERKEKWYQYILELEKFSSFPHFFGMYLKDPETFDLLFKLLSGLPDTEQDKKWEVMESQSTQKLLKIVAEILSMDKTTEFREYSIKHDFFETILERLKILTGQFKREEKETEEKEEEISPSKVIENDDGTKQIKKKKGVGYGNEGSSNTKWMKGTSEAELKKEFEVTELILNIIENFLDFKEWKIPKEVLKNIYESALLPYLEDSVRGGTLLEISKHPSKFKLVFKILRTLSKNEYLVPTLLPLDKKYHPRQIESLQSLMKSLESTATIFLSCLKPNKESNASEKISEELAKDIIETSKAIEEAIDDYNESHQKDENENEFKNILDGPLDKKYRTLLKDLRFDYIDMKEGAKIKHHYSGNFQANYTPNQIKMIRLAQELADISTALPHEHTNAVFVRCDKDRVDFMQALIMGSNGTPYGHGAFLFDIYFEDTYPNTPPKVNLTTTGHGKVRFNPNLYACGKVCLSLLGTWRGSASENWDPKVSTLLQVLLSIQAIIMSEEVYFNEPGFEGEQGTAEGEKKNEAYSNVVRYNNIKFAMIENIKNPPKGFENVIKRHFYLKQHEIMDECKKWLLYAEKRPANYIGLVNDHNSNWCTEFKKNKDQYKTMLEKAIEELGQEFKKLPVPSIHDITSRKTEKRQKKKKENNDLLGQLEKEENEVIDVSYENKDLGTGKEIDINDEKVKDRWSRYIGAMGIDAVSKQSKADILVFGIGPMSLEVVKNLVLSGCRKLTIVDDKLVSFEDLSGGFFFTESDIGKKRLDAILYKIRELNIYVKVDVISPENATEDIIKTYTIVLATEMSLKRQFEVNEICRCNNVKFISAEFRGAHCRILNDFGEKFEVIDKNGEEPVEVIIKSITNEENGIVTILDGSKHPYEDGEVILIRNVEGMAHKEDKSKTINGTLHKVKVINSKSFYIGDTTNYEPYVRNGLAKNVKTPITLEFKSMSKVYQNAKENLPIDENLQFYDFSKMNRNKLIHYCFVALDSYIEAKTGKLPQPWNSTDAKEFLEIFRKEYEEEITAEIEKYVKRFSFVSSGYLPPLGAYFGGFVSQEIIKAITQKFKPLSSVFYMDAEDIIPDFIQDETKYVNEVFSNTNHRDRGFEIVVGKQLLELIKNSTTFMIGSGAIGCELLKNFAMIGLGSGEKGKITLTDPDHIENSNLNRQFLFREKHISKPKSRTAAASILLMNPNLKNHISALLERVSDSTKNVFTNKFFESLTFVANALDNVAARRYVDQRCVENKIPLFESGTLGPKGHTQVILPYKTESYGSQNDPVEEGEIPHCTLKMFPEETLHCIEWARDIFGKKFSLQPKAFMKLKDPQFKPEKDDIKSLNECIVMATKGPKNFEDCIVYAVLKFYKYYRDDIMQLLYTYPLDSKTKDGEPFWKLPKRPPAPILKFDPENIIHCTFIASMAVLIAKIYKIPFPTNFREEKERLLIGKTASKIKVEDFVPSDEKAKSILKESADEKKSNKMVEEEEAEKENDSSDKNENELFEIFISNTKDKLVDAEEFEKDNDQNGHIDFIYAMANLRAINYKLDQMDWITTKLKAGRIVPALATTTTCVAGLQTLEICKYIRNLKIDLMRNSFLNLAVPSLQMSEPGEVKKIKVNDKVEVNLWDRWEIACTENTKFGDIYDNLKTKYELHPIGVIQGMSRIDSTKTEEEKTEFLNCKILDRLDKEDNNIDIVVLFTLKEGDDKLIENIPPIRLTFEPEKSS